MYTENGTKCPEQDGGTREVGSSQVGITHPSLPHRILKRIPKAARPCTGRLLISIINKILKDAENPTAWHMLLTFGAGILEQPTRGGRRHNLTSTIKKRVEEFPTEWPRKWAEISSNELKDNNYRKRSKLNDDQAVVASSAWAGLSLEHKILTAALIFPSSSLDATAAAAA